MGKDNNQIIKFDAEHQSDDSVPTDNIPKLPESRFCYNLPEGTKGKDPLAKKPEEVDFDFNQGPSKPEFEEADYEICDDGEEPPPPPAPPAEPPAAKKEADPSIKLRHTMLLVANSLFLALLIVAFYVWATGDKIKPASQMTEEERFFKDVADAKEEGYRIIASGRFNTGEKFVKTIQSDVIFKVFASKPFLYQNGEKAKPAKINRGEVGDLGEQKAPYTLAGIARENNTLIAVMYKTGGGDFFKIIFGWFDKAFKALFYAFGIIALIGLIVVTVVSVVYEIILLKRVFKVVL